MGGTVHGGRSTPSEPISEEVSLPASVDVVRSEDYTIHCSQPSQHTFTFANQILGIKEPHVSDPESGNNLASAALAVNVLADANVSITEQDFVDPPSEIPADEDVDVTLRKRIHNKGPYGPLDISIFSSATAPANCTVSPSAQDLLLSDVPVSGERVINEDWTISCSQVGEYTFTFANSISVTTEHVGAFDSAGTELRVSVEPTPTSTPTPAVTPAVLPTAMPPSPDDASRYSDTDTSFANSHSCHSHAGGTAADRRQRRNVVDRGLACVGVIGWCYGHDAGGHG